MKMDSLTSMIRPLTIFTAYMLMVFAASIHVIRTLRQNYQSITSTPRSDKISGKHLTRIRIFSVLASISLSVTWYFMFQFFAHSYTSWSSAKTNSVLVRKLMTITLPSSSWERIGAWLKDTSLFEEAWGGAASTHARYWWTQQIFFFTIGWAGLLYTQGSRRNIPNVWVYMLIGQFVAISFAMNLFFVAIAISEGHDALSNSKSTSNLDQSATRNIQTRQSERRASTFLTIIAVSTSLLLVIYLPEYFNSPRFIPVLGSIHLAVFIPAFLVSQTKSRPFFKSTTRPGGIADNFADVYLLVLATSFLLFVRASVIVNEPSSTYMRALWDAFKSHPAVSSVGSDAILCWISASTWIFSNL